MLRIVLFMSVFTCLYAVELGDCIVNDLATQADFDIYKYQGKWFETHYKSKTFYSADDLWLDVYQTYSMLQNGSLYMDFVARLPATQKCHYISGSLTPTGVSGKLIYSDIFGSKDYWVLATDYTGYAVVYGCPRPDAQGACTTVDALDIWVFSRTPTFTAEQLATVTSVLESACVDISILDIPAQETKCEADAGPDDCNANGAGSLGPLVWLCVAYFIWRTLY